MALKAARVPRAADPGVQQAIQTIVKGSIKAGKALIKPASASFQSADNLIFVTDLGLLAQRYGTAKVLDMVTNPAVADKFFTVSNCLGKSYRTEHLMCFSGC